MDLEKITTSFEDIRVHKTILYQNENVLKAFSLGRSTNDENDQSSKCVEMLLQVPIHQQLNELH